MKKENELWKSVVSCILIVTLMFCSPFEGLAQSSNGRGNVLENGTQIVLRVKENFKADNKADTGVINSIVETDVYSADGTKVLIKAGTPAFIEFQPTQMAHGERQAKSASHTLLQKLSTINEFHSVLAVARMEVVNSEA